MTLEVNARAVLAVEGYDNNYGSIVLESRGNPASLNTRGSGQLNQYGTVTVRDGAAFNFDGVMDNGGLIDLAGGSLQFFNNGLLTGTGTIRLSDAASTAEVESPVGQGQIFALDKGALYVSRYGMFEGTVAHFGGSAASLGLGGLDFDAATYAEDGDAERLVLTKDGSAVGAVRLADTPDTQYAVTRNTITPAQVYSNGSIPGFISGGAVIIRNAEPDNQAVTMAGKGSRFGAPGSVLVLDNAALGPNLLLTVASPTPEGSQEAGITVQGRGANYGEIDVVPSSGATPSAAGNRLEITIGAGARLDQEGTIKVLSPGLSAPIGSSLNISGAGSGTGTLNNDGMIYLGPRSNAFLGTGIMGSGTVVVDGGTVSLQSVAGTQLIDFIGGVLNLDPARLAGLDAAIKDWNSSGEIILNGTPKVDAVAFSQTSASGGDLRLLSGGTEVGDLHLLGAYATSDFRVASFPSVGSSSIGTTTVGITILSPQPAPQAA